MSKKTDYPIVDYRKLGIKIDKVPRHRGFVRDRGTGYVCPKPWSLTSLKISEEQINKDKGKA